MTVYVELSRSLAKWLRTLVDNASDEHSQTAADILGESNNRHIVVTNADELVVQSLEFLDVDNDTSLDTFTGIVERNAREGRLCVHSSSCSDVDMFAADERQRVLEFVKSLIGTSMSVPAVVHRVCALLLTLSSERELPRTCELRVTHADGEAAGLKMLVVGFAFCRRADDDTCASSSLLNRFTSLRRRPPRRVPVASVSIARAHVGLSESCLARYFHTGTLERRKKS